MRLVIVWKEETDYAREVIDWMREFEHREGSGKIESINPETYKGESFVAAHDILQYPAIVVLDSDGRVLQEWKGTPLPQLDEVAYLARS